MYDIKNFPVEIPWGWDQMYQNMCDEIIDAGIPEGFEFIQIKEKFNELRCYTNGKETPEIKEILKKYEKAARYVCCNCGRPATCETVNYLASYCDDCWKDWKRHEEVRWL